MRLKAILIMSLLGIAVGMLTVILDSLIHHVNFQHIKLINILIFIVYFGTLYYAMLLYRERIIDGFMSYWEAFKNSLYLGTIASIIISVLRYSYLKYVAIIDIDEILKETEKSMLEHYSAYGDELIDNRLSFIEFSYDPVVSSVFYFIYFMIFAIAFAIIASFFLRKIDRNIAL